MDRIDRSTIATALLNAPAWARLGLAVKDTQMRERAADAIAARIVAAEELKPDPNQLPLRFEG